MTSSPVSTVWTSSQTGDNNTMDTNSTSLPLATPFDNPSPALPMSTASDERHKENADCLNLNLNPSDGCEIDLNVHAQCHSPSNVGNEEEILGMEFCDHESAFIFYRDYGKRKGFDVRKNHQKKNKAGFVTSITIVCSKEGFRKKDKRRINPLYERPNKRVGCKAHMKCLLQNNGNYKIVSFADDHNHELVPTPMKYMLRTNRQMSEAQKAHADLVDKSGISIKATVELMGREVGGREHLGFMDKDYRNYIHRKRMMTMAKGDAGAILRYFHKMQLESSSFFYSIQLDQDDMITNMFWADARSISDYNLFGDVVCFDTTYRTNKCDRPFAPFVGVNHHKQSIIFGAALLYDETTESFKWLFETFLGAMSSKKPMTIITDECAAMASAISDIFPETQHRLCVWHLYQNAAKNLSSVFNGSKQFSKDFGDCVYEYENESEWQLAWDDMLKKYNLQQNTWLNDKYKLREKWALVYGRHTFTADMKSTQRSESMNNVLKHYLNPSLDIVRFFEHYERVLADRRHEELKADFKMIHTTPVLSASVEMLRHGADVYTPEIFKLFQEEYMRWGDYNIDKVCKNDMTSEYKVYHTSKSQDHLVKFDSPTQTITCSCMKFNFVGILCAHALKVLDKKNVKKIPPQYIMKRWTRDAKARSIINYHGLDVNDNSKESMGNLYSHLCRNFREIATFASEDNNLFTHAHKRSVELLKELQDMKKNGLDNVSLASTSQVETPFIQKEAVESMPPIEPRGIKRKPTVGRPRNRIKSALEKNKPKTTVKSKKVTAKRRLLTEEAATIDINSQDQNVTGYGSQAVNILTQEILGDCYNSQVESTTTNGAQYFGVLPHQALVHSGMASINQNFGADRSYPGLAITRPNFSAGTSNMRMSSMTQNFGASSSISTNTSYPGMTFTSHNLDAGTSNTRMANMNQNFGDDTSWQENMSYSELLQGLLTHHQNKLPQNMHERRDPL